MAIVSYSEYITQYMGEPIAETVFPRAEARAERAIAQITHGRATGDSFAALPAVLQAAVREAVCAQVEYYAVSGVEISVAGETSGGWSVGKVRVDGGSRGSASAAATMICPAAIAALEQTGLLNPQTDTLGEPPRVPWPWGVC